MVENSRPVGIFEHGIIGFVDQLSGVLQLVARPDKPVYAGYTLELVDTNGGSLVERSLNLARISGPYKLTDYADESDLRYCVRSALYHLNRIIELYVGVTQLFEKHHSPPTTLSGNTDDARIYYEIDAFLGAARRVYESLRKVLWKHFGTGEGRWKSIRGALKSELLPERLRNDLNESWSCVGERLN